MQARPDFGDLDGLDPPGTQRDSETTKKRKEPRYNELPMTLADLIRKAREIGDQFNTYAVPLSKDGGSFDIDFEAEGSNDEGWHINIIEK